MIACRARQLRPDTLPNRSLLTNAVPTHVAQVVGARWQTRAMSNEPWDGHRAVDASTGEIEFRVRGSRLVRTNNGETSYRVRDDGRVVDANSGETRFRVRDDGRVVDVNTGETVWRLRG